MVEIKATTSLYHAQLGNVNVGNILSVDEKVAEMLIKGNMAKTTSELGVTLEEPVKKKKVSKKGE